MINNVNSLHTLVNHFFFKHGIWKVRSLFAFRDAFYASTKKGALFYTSLDIGNAKFEEYYYIFI